MALAILNGRLSGWKSSRSWENLVLSIVFFSTLGSLRCTTESYLPILFLLLHLSSWQSAAVTTTVGRSWPYDKLTPSLWQKKHSRWYTWARSHAGTHSLTREHGSRHTLTCTHTCGSTHTHKRIHPLCPAMSQHTPGGRLSSAMSTGYHALWLVHLFQSCVLIGCRLL